MQLDIVYTGSAQMSSMENFKIETSPEPDPLQRDPVSWRFSSFLRFLGDDRKAAFHVRFDPRVEVRPRRRVRAGPAADAAPAGLVFAEQKIFLPVAVVVPDRLDLESFTENADIVLPPLEIVILPPELTAVLFAMALFSIFIQPLLTVVLFAVPPMETYSKPPLLTVVLFAVPPLETSMLSSVFNVNPLLV